jgi:protein dithiol:quinone oxidoreductase
MFRNTRLMFALAALACAGIIGFAFYLQYFQEMEPCPLCWFQRFAVLVLGIGFAVAAFFTRSARGAKGWALVLTILAAIGMGIAGRHIWIQNLPADQVPACGQSVLYMLDNMSFLDVFAKALNGSSDCAKRDMWLGLTLPSWTMIIFIGSTLWAWFAALRFSSPSKFR